MCIANLALVFFIFYLSGCATLPTPPPRESIASYDLNDVTYYPLITLCELRNIEWLYDTFSRTVSLSRGTHTVTLRAGDTLALVDGVAQELKDPVVIYQGTVAVPERFKQQVIDVLFFSPVSGQKISLPRQKLRKVVIDAGHGGIDPGAIGRTGLREKDVNLDIARRLARLLQAEGIQVVLTRSTDTFIPLPRRVAIANGPGVDLFVSVHANANRVRSLNGFEIYYVSGGLNDSKRALAAAKSMELSLAGASFSGRSQSLKATLWDMVYTQARAESIELSRQICRSMDSGLDVRILGIKGANFQVLRGACVPAVLVETGFLSNYAEECKLKNSYYRQKAAEALSEGIKNYGREAVLMEMAHK